MGPNVKTVENKSQATPFANQFLQQLMGFLNQQGGAQTVGPNQAGGVGNQAQQTAGANPFNLGVDTSSGVQDHTDQLIQAVQTKNASALGRNVAAQREGASVLGGRFSSGQARGEGLLRSENQGNLDQLIAGILTDQGARKTQAQQFDVTANNQRFGELSDVASRGIFQSDNIVSPGIGQQLLGAATSLGAAYLSGGGSLFGGKGSQGLTPAAQAAMKQPIPKRNFNQADPLTAYTAVPSYVDPRLFGGR